MSRNLPPGRALEQEVLQLFRDDGFPVHHDPGTARAPDKSTLYSVSVRRGYSYGGRRLDQHRPQWGTCRGIVEVGIRGKSPWTFVAIR